MAQNNAEVNLIVNSKEAEAKLEQLKSKAEALRQKFEQANKVNDKDAVRKINAEINSVNRSIKNTELQVNNLRAALERTDTATPKQLQAAIKAINKELNSGRVQRGSEEWQQYTEKLRQVKAALKEVNAEMAVNNTSRLEKAKNFFNDWSGMIAGATASLAGIVIAGKSAVKAYADMEAEEANVRKFTGMTEEQVKSLNNEFKAMDTRTAREELNKMAQEAGRLGKTTEEDVLGYVKAADKINVALDDLGSGATLTLSKLTGIFGDEKIYGTEKSLLKVGSVINELSQNCSAAAPFITEFTSRLGGIANQSHMTVTEVMALGAVIDTQNLELEASSTAIGNLITTIYKGPDKIAKAVGLDVKEFTDTVKRDMNEALIMLFEQMSKFGGMESLAKILEDMGTDGARATAVLSALAGHVDELKSQVDAANEAFAEGLSIDREFEVQNNTVQAQLDKAKKGFTEMAVSLGEKLLPAMRYCISGTSMLMRVMNLLVGFFLQHKTSIALLTAAIIVYTTALNLSIIKDQLKVFWLNKVRASAISCFRVFMNHPLGAVLAVVSLLAGALIDLATAEAETAKKTKVINDIRNDAQQKVVKEKTEIELLIAAAKNENLTLEERRKAIEKLNKIIPDYNGHLDETTGKLEANSTAAEEYINKLVKMYEVMGAQERLQEIGNKKSKIIPELEPLKERYKDIKEDRTGNVYLGATGGIATGGFNTIDRALTETKSKIVELEKQIEKLEEEEQAILNVYGDKIHRTVIGTNEEETTNEKPVIGPSDKELKAQARAEKAALREAKEALKKDLEERKSMYLQAEAENLTLYVTGQKDYEEYLAAKEALEEQYNNDVLDIHEKHNKLDIAAYGQALKQKATMLQNHTKEQQALSLRDIEISHKDNTRGINSRYFDIDSDTYQNEKWLNQALLEEDIDYLKKKADLYNEGSKERAEIEREIREKLAADQLNKQKETAQAIESFEQQYRNASGSRREKMEIAVLDDLLKKKLISEEEYQVAVSELKRKHQNEDIERVRKTDSEYADLILNLWTSWDRFFNDLDTKSTDFWDRLAEAATSAYAVIGGMLSQYTGYAAAQRDLEVAQVEKSYDRQISAAKNNTKKKEELEAQKEAAVAKVKQKYNEKEMKLELAQAYAQTAVAAINAYASASKVNWLLGPIAAAMATAAGMVQIATIKKQHEAEAAGYYSGGYTKRDRDNHREVGVVHANEFVANHEAVASPVLSPILDLIDHAQRTNTIGSLSRADVSRVLGVNDVSVHKGPGAAGEAVSGDVAVMTDMVASRQVIERLIEILEGGIEAKMIMDGEDGFVSKWKRYQKLTNNPKL